MRDADRIRYYCRDGVAASRLSSSTREKIRALHEREGIGNTSAYAADLRRILDRERCLTYTSLPVAFGDMRTALRDPVLAKCRPVRGARARNHALLPLNRDRHWNAPLAAVAAHDVPWSRKVGRAIWRGVSTGEWVPDRGRLALVSRWADTLDVGVTRYVQGRARVAAHAKPEVPIEEQLTRKYIIMVEGNDVATGLAWALFSRSVVLMPTPRHETWLMEGLLKPGVHYVRVKDDFSDLRRRLDWCERNQRRCREISANATRWVSRMMDEEREADLAVGVLRRFMRTQI